MGRILPKVCECSAFYVDNEDRNDTLLCSWAVVWLFYPSRSVSNRPFITDLAICKHINSSGSEVAICGQNFGVVGEIRNGNDYNLSQREHWPTTVHFQRYHSIYMTVAWNLLYSWLIIKENKTEITGWLHNHTQCLKILLVCSNIMSVGDWHIFSTNFSTD